MHLEPPPEVPRTIPGNILMKVLPIVMIFMSVGMMAFMFVIYAIPLVGERFLAKRRTKTSALSSNCCSPRSSRWSPMTYLR